MPIRHQRSRMFARGKRKHPEDEPLVPHGLVWQATDEPDVDEAASAKPKVSAEPTEMPLRQDHRPESTEPTTKPAMHVQERSSAQPDFTPNKLGAISPPIPWPSPKTASVIRRTPPPVAPANPAPTDASVPAVRKPLPGIPQTSSVAERERKLEIIELDTTTAQEKSQQREAVTRVLESVRQRTRNIYDSTVRSLKHSRLNVRSAYRSINFKSQFSAIRQAADLCAHKALSGSRSLRAGLQSRWASNAPRIVRAKSAVGRFSSHILRTSVTRTSDLAQRVRTQRVRIRIARSPRAQAFIQRTKLEWMIRREAMRRDSRLWTSLAMAALSALLTVGVISAARRYEPGAVSSNKARNSQSQQNPITPASLIAPNTALASTTNGARTTHSNTIRQQQSKRSPSAAPEKPAAHQAHHIDDGDYVAPNTYHYYGTKGKSR